MKTRVEDKDLGIVAARVVLSDVESVSNRDSLRAVGFAALFAAAKGKEVEVLIGMRDAARDAGEIKFSEIPGEAIGRIQSEC